MNEFRKFVGLKRKSSQVRAVTPATVPVLVLGANITASECFADPLI